MDLKKKMEGKKGIGEAPSMSTRGVDGLQAQIFQIIQNHVGQGLFVVVDGLDGIGKGEIERVLRGYEEKQGKAVFDAIAWSKAYERLPELKDFWETPVPHFNTVMNAEPTYVGIGKVIRDEITRRNSRQYPSEVHVEAYSIDRLISMQMVVVPALEHGLNVLQSRCVASTLCYQALLAQIEGKDIDVVRERILKHPGNIYQLEYAPNLLIIPTVESSEVLQERLKERGKNEKEDKSMFENAEFQGKLKPLYEDSWLRKVFEEHGTSVAYLNAGVSVESTRNQALEVYKQFSSHGEVPEVYRTPKSVLEGITERRG